PMDESNPQLQSERRQLYKLVLQINAADVPYALIVGRLRRSVEGGAYEKVLEFVPACTSMAACSELLGHWRDITTDLSDLFNRYHNLYRAMQRFIVLFKERGLETETDLESIAFVGRMVVALQSCQYDSLDPLQPPQQFFGGMRRFLHAASVYFDISPPVQQFYDMLKGTGETEYLWLMEQQKALLAATPRLELNEDLSVDARFVRTMLASLGRLERALEGKYLDFRINRALEAMNFIFDYGSEDGQPRLYKFLAKVSRVEGAGLTMVFGGLKLEGREKYRLVLAGEAGVSFEIGSRIAIE